MALPILSPRPTAEPLPYLHCLTYTAPRGGSKITYAYAYRPLSRSTLRAGVARRIYRETLSSRARIIERGGRYGGRVLRSRILAEQPAVA